MSLPPRLLAAVALAAALGACGGGGGPQAPLPPDDPALVFFAPELEIDLSEFEKTSSGLYVRDLTVGNGPTAHRTSRVRVYYLGWLPDGTLFDGNAGGEPFHFRLGGREVIRGWNEGIVGMKVGGRRQLVVRPGLAYGSSGRGDVPPGSTLVFEIQLVDAN